MMMRPAHMHAHRNSLPTIAAAWHIVLMMPVMRRVVAGGSDVEVRLHRDGRLVVVMAWSRVTVATAVGWTRGSAAHDVS